MDRELWVHPTGDVAKVTGAALEAGADGVVITEDQRGQAQGVGTIALATRKGDDVDLGERTARIVTIEDPEDQEAARDLVDEVDVLIVAPHDWTIIPLENLIAWTQGTGTRLFARVEDAEEAELAITTLEAGVRGLVLATDDPATVKAVAHRLSQRDGGQVDLVEGEVLAVEDAGMGDRVCVDTTSLLAPDEGLLVGSASAFLVLVASEATEAGYVASRPFRVNAGAVHAYVQATEDQTKYLSEVQAGTRLLVVDRDGATRTVTTGRAKVERRPMFLVRVRAEDRDGSLVVQNAETIRLVTPEGPKSVSEIVPGDTVLVHLAHETGRHFGQAIEETIEER